MSTQNSPSSPLTPLTPATPATLSTSLPSTPPLLSFHQGEEDRQLAARKRRSLHDPIYFIDHQVRANSVSFRVLGTSGSDYAVDYFLSQRLLPQRSAQRSQPIWTCACRDFQIRRRPCKHIHFIWYRVLGIDTNEDTGPFFDSASAVNDRLLSHHVAHQYTLHALDNSSNSSSNSIPTDSAKETQQPSTATSATSVVEQRSYLGQCCPICYEEFSSDCSVYYCQEKCGNSVHQECFQAFVRFSKKANCPFCRHHMHPDGIDPFLVKHSRKRHRY